jgi:hypothetical protein
VACFLARGVVASEAGRSEALISELTGQKISCLRVGFLLIAHLGLPDFSSEIRQPNSIVKTPLGLIHS